MSPDETHLTPVRPGRSSTLRPWHVHSYRLTDDVSGVLIYGLCLFSPWAFGTTENWSTWVMNIGSYALGVLWLGKLALRRFKGYPAGRWANGSLRRGEGVTAAPCRGVTVALFALTLSILLFTFISALNARATYDPPSFSFIYHEAVWWLPSSLDGASTWFAFWQYLGLAAFFWGLRDWVLGQTEGEQRAAINRFEGERRMDSPFLPARLRGLLWVLCVNGAVLGIEGIVQRLEGSGRLLFLVKPVVNPGAETQFGPWAYRANAAAYFNLLWPVCLGFWWTLQRSVRSRRFGHHLLLVCTAVMAACPIVSTSRGGAVISVGLALAAGLFLGTAHLLFNPPRDWTFVRWAITLILILAFLAGGIALGYRLGWGALAPRMEEFEVGLEQRERMFDVARPMVRDYPWFGTGPGTFGSIFQLYRGGTDAYWPAQLHNDWLETRITFGRVGSVLIGASFVLVMARWFLSGGIHGGRRFVVMLWLAVTGVLVHARWDFPFQIHSLVFLFVLWCVVLFTLSRRTTR
ncbi:MAG: O-antigen ligase family protein [Verrucomicrobia bacterium]|nr:O-antigen ligase family protein [Verrucomicrobiota bacterium]